MKRTMDIVGSAIGLLLLWPVFLIVAVMIKLDDRGPVFFKQERMGRRFNPFLIYKFRTMAVQSTGGGSLLTVQNDRRVTNIGRVLRRTKLDELPQLLNVLKGDMSLVGARPEVARFVNLFREEYSTILKHRPGITDMASLQFREESNLLSRTQDAETVYIEQILPQKLKLSLEYARRASFLFDLQVLLKTVICLFYPVQAIERLVDNANPYRLWLGLVIQAAIIVFANTLAYAIRFEGAVPVAEHVVFLSALPVILVARLLWLYPFRLYHGVWRYSGISDAVNIAMSVTLSSVTSWFAIRMLLGITTTSRAVFFLDGMLCIALLGSIRAARRLHHELRTGGMPTRKVLIVGAEDLMERVVREMQDHNGHDCRLVGLLNGDAGMKGVRIHGVKILGTKDDLADVVRKTKPDEILIAMPAASDDERKALLEECRGLGTFARSVPNVSDFLLNRHAPQLTEGFSAEDLLFRDPICTDRASARRIIEGRRIMITGAGGSIGSEICRQVAASEPATMVLFERHEFALYEIERELRKQFPGVAIEPVIGDVADARRVGDTMRTFRPHLVFHAAAYKHVPMMERNPSEALRTNSIGTRVVAAAAAANKAEAFVLISTDKAVEPVSVMGISKRIAELAVQLMSQGCKTKILTVRFGNVLESSGSMLPLFREQIERGGPVTVTHTDVTRLFMTIPEAVQLILQAATMGGTGDVFVLDMGKPVRILDLANALIRLYGLTPGKDIDVKITGLRPGERLFEKLLNDDETVWKSADDKILRAVSRADRDGKLEEMSRLLHVLEQRIGAGVKESSAIAASLKA